MGFLRRGKPYADARVYSGGSGIMVQHRGPKFLCRGCHGRRDESYALTAIGPRYGPSIEVRDIIMNPPAKRAYETLKAELIKRLSLSQEHKTRRLLEHEEIGRRS